MNLEIKRLYSGGRPTGIKVDRRLNRLFVAEPQQGHLIVIDLATEGIICKIPIGKNPYGIALLN